MIRDAIMDKLAQANEKAGSGDHISPHCDPRVLHEPGECSTCDVFPQYQALRILWGVNFTGGKKGMMDEDPDNWKALPCPADFARGDLQAHNWYGNRPNRPREDDRDV
jgi:hypothetical protein